MEQTDGQKSFWEKPEGVTGMLFTGGLIIGVGWILYHFLPYIIELLQNTITAIALGLVTAGLLYVIFNNKVQNLLSFFFKVAMKKITSVFVTINPIAIIKVYIDELRKRREKMNTQITMLKGQKGQLTQAITENQRAIEKEMGLAASAERQGNKAQVTLHTREAARQRDSNSRLIPLQEKLEALYRFFNKIYENSGYMIQDMSSEVKVREKEYEAIKAGHSVMKSALSIFKGTDDQKLMFDEAMEFISNDMGNKLGEMERFMDESEEFISTIDIQNGMYQEDGLKMLEKWNENDFSFSLSPATPKVTIDKVPVAHAIEVKMPNNTDNKFGEFFK